MHIRLRNARSLLMMFTSFCVLLLLSITLIFVFYARTEQIIIGQSRAAGQEAIGQVRKEMDRRLSELRLVSGRIHASERIQRFHHSDNLKMGESSKLKVDIVSELTSIKNITPFISDILVYFPAKKAAFSATAYYTDKRYYEYVATLEGYDLETFRTVMGEQTFMGAPLESRMVNAKTGDRYVCFAQSNNTFLFPHMQIFLMVSESTLSNMFTGVYDRLLTGPIVLDGQGTPITPEGKALYDETFKASSESLELANPDTTELLVEYSDSYGWVYMLPVSTEVLLREAASARNWMVTLLLVLSGIGMVLSVLMSFMHYRPIRKLVILAENLLPKPAGPQITSNQEYETQIIERAINTTRQAYSDMLARHEGQLNQLREHLVRHLIFNAVRMDESLLEQMRGYNLELPYGRFLCVACRYDIMDFDMRDVQLVGVVLRGVASDMLLPLGRAYCAETVPRTQAIVVNLADELPEEETMDRVRRALFDMRVRLSEEFQLNVTFSVGGTYRDISGIHKSWKEAKRSLDFARVQGLDMICASDMRDFDRAYDLSLDTELQLHNLVRTGNEQGTRALLTKILDDNLLSHTLSEAAARCLFIDLLSTGIKLSRDLSVPEDALSELSDISFEQILDGAPQAPLRDKLLALFLAICRHVHAHRPGQEMELENRMLAYIHENYTDANFSQTSMAETLGISPSYLSASFRNCTGKKMVDYINRMRVERAKEFLNNSTLTLEEIAPHIGCTNALTLIRIFKKHTGITPGQYRDCQ